MIMQDGLEQISNMPRLANNISNTLQNIKNVYSIQLLMLKFLAKDDFFFILGGKMVYFIRAKKHITIFLSYKIRKNH